MLIDICFWKINFVFGHHLGEEEMENEIYQSKTTFYVLACWILAAFGGLMFGYDIGISGIFRRTLISITKIAVNTFVCLFKLVPISGLEFQVVFPGWTIS